MMEMFRKDRRFIALSGLYNGGVSYSNGFIELAQLNDMFWVRLTQVIATVIGY